MAQILVIEDEATIRRGLVDLLAYHGHQPTPVADGTVGLERALGEPWDLLLVDVMLPGTDGFSITRAVRERHPGLGILLLTAKGAEEDILEGFRAGCDDYITKPFSIAQLMARVEALLRRSVTQEAALELGEVLIDADNLEARVGEASVRLSLRDVELLQYLSSQRHRIVSRVDLLREVWGYVKVEGVETRAVDMHLVKLRRKLETVTSRPVIETIRGAGYRLHTG